MTILKMMLNSSVGKIYFYTVGPETTTIALPFFIYFQRLKRSWSQKLKTFLQILDVVRWKHNYFPDVVCACSLTVFPAIESNRCDWFDETCEAERASLMSPNIFQRESKWPRKQDWNNGSANSRCIITPYYSLIITPYGDSKVCLKLPQQWMWSWPPDDVLSAMLGMPFM